jgi:methionine synthase I (cobalamin-dependent)
MIISSTPFRFGLEEKIRLNQIGINMAKKHGFNINAGEVEERYVAASLGNVYKIKFYLNLHPEDTRYSGIYVPEDGLEKI